MTEQQRTIKQNIVFEGIGLHTGEKVRLEICPAPANHGYKFQRTDLENQPIIKADVDLVVATDRGTTLEANGARVYTTEHVLAALYGCQVDNALIKLDGPEIPIMDGSALPFVAGIEAVGYEDQDAVRDYFELTENIPWEDLEKALNFWPFPMSITASPSWSITNLLYSAPNTQACTISASLKQKSPIAARLSSYVNSNS